MREGEEEASSTDTSQPSSPRGAMSGSSHPSYSAAFLPGASQLPAQQPQPQPAPYQQQPQAPQPGPYQPQHSPPTFPPASYPPAPAQQPNPPPANPPEDRVIPDSSSSGRGGFFGQVFLGQALSRRTQAAAAAASAAVAAASLGGGAAADDGPSVSQAAERHRLISETTGLTVQVVAEWIAESVPFLLLLTWGFIVNHFSTLMITVWLAALTMRANADTRRIVAMRREAASGTCLAQAAVVAVVAGGIVAFTLPDTELLRALALGDVRKDTGIECLLLVALADSVLRFASLCPKLLVIAWFRRPGAGSGSGFRLPRFGFGAGSGAAGGLGGAAGGGGGAGGHERSSPARLQRQQSRVLTVVECGIGLYRALVPAPIWYSYFVGGGISESPLLSSLFCGVYLTIKTSSMSTQVRTFALALKTATRQGSLYGTYMGRDDGELGTYGACPVCQEPVCVPVRLDCGHIFCEDCILEWLERDRTCPMCRANVRPAGLQLCTDGASPLLPSLF
ncbi:hypothetical protein HYH03_009425 [Edaphochlamys debaryana]|uniref:RING-type domain-containing protein n=1 Tax=Edaphochlamys debaryana TaxID=47281 RepID=A0A836BWY9_9CHLO|nr:hypothetical protein HYH03_009425 [Edaphochlamys debaryana]|eukprot:KAG2492176.1 hypothetical protein HYH03_009425 [Edaphochlamys debaryana]